jgi:SNF family Na+-dependent transporter
MAFFPSAVCAHGQTGNFVAVYFICMLMVGFPLAYLHLSLGQFSGCNPINVFEKLCPAFKGIGWSWLLLTAPLLIISNMNAVWSLYYMFLSGKALVTDTPLPWAHQHRYTLEHTEPVGTIQEFLSGAEKERNTTTEDPQIVLRTPLAQDFRPPTPDYYQ